MTETELIKDLNRRISSHMKGEGIEGYCSRCDRKFWYVDDEPIECPWCGPPDKAQEEWDPNDPKYKVTPNHHVFCSSHQGGDCDCEQSKGTKNYASKEESQEEG